MSNPFYRGLHLGHKFYLVDAKSRIEAIRTFNKAQCDAALVLPDLQATVRQALGRRLQRVTSVKS